MNRFEKQIQKLSIMLLLALCACSSGPMVHFFSLPATTSGEDGAKWTRVSEDPYVLKRNSIYGDHEIFLTSIEECGNNRKDLSASIGRQLFVGFQDLRVRLQQMYPINGAQLLRSIATAKFESKPVVLVSYTGLDGDCSHDVVLWFPKHEQMAPVLHKDIADFEKNLNTLFKINS